MRLAAVLSVLSGIVGAVASVTIALVRSDFVILGMSAGALIVAMANSGYVFWNVTRPNRLAKRIDRLESQASDILDRHSD